MATVVLKNVNKVYPSGNQAVFDFNLDINDKDFIVLVGPSGCGKSTTLRMIAGLEEISSGELYIDGEFMNDVLPKNRGIAMVFQSYALFPHMTVYDNMAFGLKLRKVPKDEIKRRIYEVAATLGLEPYLDRKPKNLSGGQRQRVALGRAIVRDAKVFLFDEPLSNLDAKLRGQMRTEIARIHRNIGATSIYVTHDQIEAMTMATRIVVMKDGHIQQVGSPEEIYNNPANVFVGGFIGTPAMNFVTGTANVEGYFTLDSNPSTLDSEPVVHSVKLPSDKFNKIKELGLVGAKITLGIRPEEIYLDDDNLKRLKDSQLAVKVEFVEMLGHESNVHFEIGTTQVVSVMSSKRKIKDGESIKVAIDLENCHYFNAADEMNIFNEGYVPHVEEEPTDLNSTTEEEQSA